MPKQAREDILREIQSHIEEFDGGSNSLIERFGPPQELADQYLDGEPVKPTLSKKAIGFGRTVFLFIGITVAALIAVIAVVVRIYTTDDFDYANEGATELTDGRSLWPSINIATQVDLEIQQARVTLYWHDKPTLDWKCRSDDQDEDFNPTQTKIRHNSCLLFLPVQPATIRSQQSHLVMVRPRAAVHINLVQSDLRIAENRNDYQYQIEQRRSSVDPFRSVPNAPVKIKIVADESSVKQYEY